MIETKNVMNLYKKFSLLLSKAYYEAKLSIETINEKMTFGDYFDFLEKDELDSFLDKDVDAIIREMFGELHLYDKVDNDVGALYWSGEQYISIFLNCSIPLKTIFLLFPLQEMVNCYEIYHEMNRSQLFEHFYEDIFAKRSILKLLRKQKGYSVRQLWALTGIPEQTIKYYESSNFIMYNAPHKNITRIIDALSCSPLFFRKESNFLPFSYGLLDNNDFVNNLSNEVGKYIGVDNLVLEHIAYHENEQPSLIIGSPSYVLLWDTPTKDKKIFIFDEELESLIKLAIDKTARDCIYDTPLF